MMTAEQAREKAVDTLESYLGPPRARANSAIAMLETVGLRVVAAETVEGQAGACATERLEQ